MQDRDRVAELRHLAHEVRNALNGAAVNLEVARGRAQRGNDVAELTPFLDTAVQQLESVAELYQQYTVLVAEITDRTTTVPESLSSATQAVKP